MTTLLQSLIRIPLLAIAPALLSVTAAAAAEPKPLFDGRSLDGWDGDTAIWRVEDGCITGGDLTKTIPQNEFLATKAEYADFVLRLKFKLTGTSGFINSGVQIRSQRDPNSSEMIGYQCDIGDPTWWGSIYDESRRNRVLAQSDMKALEKVLKRNDWNEYEIRAEGRRIITKINGVQAVDYTEPDEGIPQRGRIGIQIHGGGAAQIQVKDITIEELPSPDGKPEVRGAPPPPDPASPSPQSPADQQASFSLPPGFGIELVAAEQEGIGKFIAVDWDSAGRMWTMTALEYPVDANENPAAAKALFENGGRDRILVFDDPYGPGPHQPRTWADGLAMPLGILPAGDACYVQYGPDIRLYRDTDGDGRADRFEVVLTGFGIDDSHLFPHQFTRAPDGWIYLAQGAFNHGTVRRADGRPFETGGLFSTGADSVKFSYCKLARMRPDGSDFQLVSSGPNNIWGLVVTRGGEMFIQEANDLGYPVVPFIPGLHLPGVGNDRLKPYAPTAPETVSPAQMGGTGLSGLALSESTNGWPAPYGGTGSSSRIFYVANPITSRIQMVREERDDTGKSRFSKLADFCLSSDPWFRPVAIAFGPDNCLYIVDWYNQIISHNEVPRNHPDRDRTRGRIWRIRHRDQPRIVPENLTKLDNAALQARLNSPNAVEARLARDELMIRNQWTPREPAHAGDEPAFTILRLGGGMQRNGPDAPSLAAILRAADGDPGTYETRFRRFLARAYCEIWPDAVAALLRSPEGADLPAESRMLAALSLPPAASAEAVAAILPSLDREPDEEELLRLVSAPEQPAVAGALRRIVARPSTLEALLRVRNRLPAGRLQPVLTGIGDSLLKTDDSGVVLAARLAGAFSLRDLEPALLDALTHRSDDVRAAILDGLRDLGPASPDRLRPFLANRESPLRLRALGAVAASPSPQAAEIILGLANDLTAPELHAAINRLSGHPNGAAAIAAAFVQNRLPDDLLDAALVDRLQSVLEPGHPALTALLDSRASLFRHVLALDGKDGSFARAGIELEGPFTVEAWVRLEAPLTNADSLLGGENTADFNFFDGRFRVYVGGDIHDAIVASRPQEAGAWTHIAVTRNARGQFRIYLNGEPDPAEGRPYPGKLGPLDIGYSRARGGTAGSLMEFRVWNRERTAEEIRSHFSRTLEGQKPDGLTHLFTGTSWPEPAGGARVARTMEFPPLLPPGEAEALEAAIARYEALAAQPGDPEKGRLVFAACLSCHTVGNEGARLGPPLDGSAHRPVEHLLRAILTPDAAVEGGYRTFRVRTRSGEVTEGFLVSRDDEAVVVRLIGGSEKRIEAADIETAGYLNRSLMSAMYPVAFQALPDENIRDLFAWIRTLR